MTDGKNKQGVIYKPLSRNEKVIWAAGLIDGEGCIFIKRDRPSKKSKHKSEIFTLGLKVTMTHRETVFRLLEIFRYGHITIRKKLEGRKQAYSWTVRSKQAIYVLNLISPFLGCVQKLVNHSRCGRMV